MGLFRGENVPYAVVKAQPANVSNPAIAVYQQANQQVDPIQLYDAATGQTEVFGVGSGGNITKQAPYTPAAYTGSADAIAFPNAVNTAQITGSSAIDACTLATPGAADNGKLLLLTTTSAYAHTVTAASGIFIEGASSTYHILTAAAHAGASALLYALNGNWVVVSTSNFTLS